MKILSVAFCMLLLLSCTRSDSEILDPAPPPEAPVDSLSLELFNEPDVKFVNVNFTNEKVIEGSTNHHVFSTNDTFKIVRLTGYTPVADISAFVVADSTILRIEHTGSEVTVLYSTNYGDDLKAFHPSFDQGLPPADVRSYAFIDEHNILLSAGQSTPTQQGFSHQSFLYRINIDTKKGELVSTVNDYYAFATHVKNNRVWMTWSSDKNEFVYFTTGYVSFSDDAGLTWSSPVFVDYGYYLWIAAGSENDLFAWSPEASYYSTDMANTWSRSSAGVINFTSVQFADQKTVYALGNNKLMKSIDGGINWSVMDKYVGAEPVWGTPKFINALQGIVFNDVNIFYTENGGDTWRLVLSTKPAH